MLDHGRMTMNLVKEIAELDIEPDLHAARLLVLISVFCGEGQNGAIEGITKLAKLDFLLRYPVMLEHALEVKGRSTKGLSLADHERLSVESEMVRYRFGPWDHKYREFLNILVAKRLIFIRLEGRKVIIGLSPCGYTLAEELAVEPIFQDYARRSKLLKSHFDIKATKLMQFIYETFPEVISLRSNERIPT